MSAGAAVAALTILPDFIELLQDRRAESQKEIDYVIDQMRDRGNYNSQEEFDKIEKAQRARFWNNLNAQMNGSELKRYLAISRLDTTKEKERKQKANDNLDLIQQMSNDTFEDLPQDEKPEYEAIRKKIDNQEKGIEEEEPPPPPPNPDDKIDKVDDEDELVKDLPPNEIPVPFEEDEERISDEPPLPSVVEQIEPKRKKAKKQQQQQQSQPLPPPPPQTQDEDMEYIEVYLDSYDCSVSFSPQHTSLNWPKFLLNNRQLDNITAIKVLECSIPNTNYLFLANEYKYIYVFESNPGTASGFEIPEGSYTATNLASTISTAINGCGLNKTYTVTVSETTGKLAITSNTVVASDYFTLYSYSQKTAKILGLTYNGLGLANGIDSTLYVSPANPSVLTGTYVFDITGGSLFYYVNSNSLGSTIDIQLPSNGIYGSNGVNNRQIAKVPIQGNAWDITFWQEPCPDRWFQVENINLNNGLDLFISNSQEINTPLDFNGMPFSIKLGLQRRMERTSSFSLGGNSLISQGSNTSNLKYYNDSTREGWFEADDPSGYRDPWDFSQDTLERQYIPASRPIITQNKRRRR